MLRPGRFLALAGGGWPGLGFRGVRGLGGVCRPSNDLWTLKEYSFQQHAIAEELQLPIVHPVNACFRAVSSPSSISHSHKQS